ncbi:MAG: glycosyltransferase family 87 protein [Arcicella sp.]|nr:glycosyltransferase family 87 protein [Arcicella sp.]
MKNKLYLSLLLIIVCVLAIKEGLSEDIHGDYFIVWNAGLNFLEGRALYAQIGGAEEFLYPPFAPMFFALEALIPFKVAACLMSFINLIGWFGVIYLAKQIIAFYLPNAAQNTNIKFFKYAISYKWLWRLIFIATIRYFWHNFIWVNINVIITLLTFGGILLYLRKQIFLGLLCLVIATSLKVMPGLFLVIIALYNPPKVWLMMISIACGLLGALFIFRGWELGIKDFTDYYQVGLRPFLNGKVYLDWIALSIPSMLFKLFTAHPNNFIDYHILDLPVKTVKMIATILQFFIIGIVLKKPLMNFIQVIFGRKSFAETQISLKTWCLAYLSLVLVAGVSWEGHHVTLALVLPATILMIKNEHYQWRNTLIIICLLIGFMTKDLLGSWLYDYSMEWSFITFFVIFVLFVLSVKTEEVVHQDL